VLLSPADNVRSKQLDHADHLAVNSRLLVRQQKKHNFQTCCHEHVEQSVDDDSQIIDAGDWELNSQTHSSGWDILKPGAQDNDGLSRRACTAASEEQSASVISRDRRRSYFWVTVIRRAAALTNCNLSVTLFSAEPSLTADYLLWCNNNRTQVAEC